MHQAPQRLARGGLLTDHPMIADPALLHVLALLGAGGARIAARACRVADPSLAAALGLPLALSGLLLLCSFLARFLPLWACLGLGLALVGLGARQARGPLPEPEFRPLDRKLRWLVGLALGATLLYLHASQLARPADDFWIQYPLTRSILTGNFPPVNPYFPDLPWEGRPGRPVLLATLSCAVGGDTLRAQWLLELVLTVNSLFLWILALRRASGSARGGVLGGLLVFLGVNVGSRVGLMDAYDNENLLVYLLLAALMALANEMLSHAARRWPLPRPLLAALVVVAAALGGLSVTHFLLALATLVPGCLLVSYWRRSAARSLAGAMLLVALASTLLVLAQGGGLLDLARGLVGSSPSPEARLGLVPPTTIRFPKEPLLALRLGMDPYQRFSFALDTALFRRYQPALDDGGYASIFGTKVLVLHWLPTWLCPLTLAWGFWRRSRAGLLLGCFGVLAYVTPGLVDFGPVREAEFLRWEFASGVAFAALLGLALADLWERRPAGPRGLWVGALLVLLVLLDLVGAQRRLNDVAIEMQRNPELLVQTLLPWYPGTEAWLLGLPGLGLAPADLEAARWLRQNAAPGSRVLTDFRSEGHDSVDWEAAVAGQAGLFPVGHAPPPRWRPAGSTPDLPSEPTVAYRQTADPQTLAGLGVDWILRDPSRSLQPPLGLAAAAEVGLPPGVRRLYRLGQDSAPGPLDRGQPPLEVEASTLGIPGPRSWEPGIAYPVTVRLARPLEGWLAPVLREPGQVPVNLFSPVTVRIQGESVSAWLVPPLEEGSYQLSWLSSPGSSVPWRELAGSTPAPSHFSQALEEDLRVEHFEMDDGPKGWLTLRNASSEVFDPGGPLRVQGWVWDPSRHGYRVPFSPEVEVETSGPLAPGASRRLQLKLKAVLPPGGRVDVTAAARYGPSITIPRWEAPPPPVP